MTGELIIITHPEGAEIFIDGENTLRTTPSTFTLTAGPHAFILRYPLYEDVSGTFKIEDGKTYILEATLQSELTRNIVILSGIGLFVSFIALIKS